MVHIYQRWQDRDRVKVDCSGHTGWGGGLTSVHGPQADAGLPVELFYTCWPCGGVEDVPLLVPGSLIMCCQLTLHIQVRHRCQEREARETDQVRQKQQEERVYVEPWIIFQAFLTLQWQPTSTHRLLLKQPWKYLRSRCDEMFEFSKCYGKELRCFLSHLL